MFEITGIMVARKPPALDTITHYYFQGRNGEDSLWVDKPAAVAYVQKNPEVVYVSGGGSTAFVEVLANGASPYLRTKPDGTTSDNLLSLTVYN
jgi:Ethanolamine utilization protein EutJ (predicted chaperonin)